MQKGLDFVREQSGTVPPPDPGVPRDPRPAGCMAQGRTTGIGDWNGRMGSLAFKYLHGGQ
jgi:hypothetical protein